MTALFANFDFFKQNVESAKSSLGALNEQNEIYLDSIDAKLDQLSATADSIKFDLFMGTDWGNAIDALNTILKGVRGLIDDFGGLSGILVTTGALLTKTFAPKLITDFMTQWNTYFGNRKMLDGKNFIDLSSLTELFSDSQKTIDFMRDSLINGTSQAADNTRILNSLLVSGGKEAVGQYNNLRQIILDITQKQEILLRKTAERNEGRFTSGLAFNNQDDRLSSLNYQEWWEFQSSLSNLPSKMGLTGEALKSVNNQIKTLINQGGTTGTVYNSAFDLILQKLLETNPELQKATEKIRMFTEASAKMQKYQKYTSYIAAGTIALQGLSSVIDKINDGDKIGAISSGIMSIGSALMMINPLAGGIAMGIGAVFELVSKNTKELRQEMEENLEKVKDYDTNLASLQSASKAFDNLSQKTNLTSEQQNELNNSISTLQELLGTDDSFVAYYDEAGNAVYKTTEQVQDLIDKWKEEKKEALEAAQETAKALSVDDIKEYNKQLEKRQENSEKYQNALKAQEIVNQAKANGQTNLNLSQIKDINILTGLQSGVSNIDTWTGLLQGYVTQYNDAIQDAEEKIQEGWDDLQSFVDSTIQLEVLNKKSNSKNFNLFGTQFEDALEEGFKKGEISAENFSQNFESIVSQIYSVFDSGKYHLNIDKLLAGNENQIKNFRIAIAETFKDNDKALDFVDILNDMADAWEKNAEAAKEAKDPINSVSENIENITDVLDEFASKSNIASEAIADFTKDGTLTNSTLKELNSAFSGISGYNDFIAKMQMGKMTAQEFKQGLSELLEAYLQQEIAVNGVTAATANSYVAMIQQSGAVSSTEDAVKLLITSLINNATATGDLTDKTWDEIAAIAQENGGLELNKNMLYAVQLAKETLNGSSLNFSNDIAAIEGYVKALGGTITSLEMLRQAKVAQDAGANAYAWSGMSDVAAAAKAEVQAALDNAFNIDVSIPKPSGGGSGKSGGGGSSKTEEYKAEIDKFEEKTKAIEQLERQISDVNNKISDTEDLKEKNKLLEEHNQLLEEEKKLQLDLNNARDEEISKKVKELQSIGFDIEYDPTQDNLLIKNKEHINELTKGSTEDTNKYRKAKEEDIKTIESWNEANQEAADKFKELNRQIEKNNKSIKENAYNDFKNQQEDILFNTIFYENLESGASKVREIYLMVFNNWQAELDKMIAKGMTLADDEVQEAIKKLYDLQDKIDDASDKIYENQKDRIDDLLDFFSTASPKAISLVGKKIDLTNQQIAENLEKGTEESINKAIELYQELWKYQKQALELQKELLEQQKDDYDDVISAVTGAIDKEIDKLKEEQEALKEQNEEREKEIELMKLKAALELAQSQKTILVYHKNQGFIWEADQEAIDEAKKNLNEFYADQEQDEIQKRIDALEKYKDKWSSIPDDIEQAENEIKAAEILGSDWQSKIFNMREDVVAEFGKNYKTTYDGIKQLDEQINNGYTPIVEKIEELIAKLAELQEQAEETANSMNFDTGYSKSYYANANGQAPTGLKTGDTVTTMGGTYVVSTTDPKQEGWGYNKDSGYWSKLLGATEEIQKRLAAQDSARLNGGQVMQPEMLEMITEALQEEMPELLNATNEGLSNTNSQLKTLNEISLDKISTDFKNYSSSIEKAINNTDAGAKNAKASASWASDSAKDAARSASDAEKYAADAAASARDAARSAADASSSASSQSDSVEVHHRGIDSGLAGSPTKIENNLFELANGGLKEDEVLSVLQKGEAIFTSKQLATLGQSVNSLVLLNDLQQKQLQIGLTQGFNNNVNSAVPREGNNISFGDININMTGVENQEQFSSALKNNIKSIFAQAVAGI